MVTDSDPLNWNKENVTTSSKKASGSSPKTVTFESKLPRNKTRQSAPSSAKNHKYYPAAAMLYFCGTYEDYEMDIQQRAVDDLVLEFEVNNEADYHDELIKLCCSDWGCDVFDEDDLDIEPDFDYVPPMNSSQSAWCSSLYGKQSSLSLSSLRIASANFPKRKASFQDPEPLPCKRASRISLSPLPPIDDDIDYAIKFAGEDLDHAIAKNKNLTRHPSSCFTDSRQKSDFWNDMDNVAF